ncbi:hypothetical protein [Nocardioides stalactiti]|uniref:hypothetical protein n=1 Tax=Nocardioides stalactiti TaxID=2755356 RepID=UPI001604181B|nr:hypothetical protein [Nocardioides stalactiti]
MRDALNTLVPLFVFMMLPIWVPLLTATFGWIADLFGSGRKDELATRLAAVKERSHPGRGQHAPEIAFAEAA